MLKNRPQVYQHGDYHIGNMMIDVAGHLHIIDFFRKQPCINDMGRMWGSSRFQAPEEFRFGAVIDEVTNVYTVGATALPSLASTIAHGTNGGSATSCLR